MQTRKKNFNCISLISLLVFGMILAPVMPTMALAEEAVGAAGSNEIKKPAGQAAGAAAGVDVSGTPVQPAPAGEGALAPPPDQEPEKQPPASDQSAEEKKVPEGIGASAGTAGTSGTKSGSAASLGWKIGAGVLGLGVLIGAAGSGGGGGGGSTPTHNQ